MKTKESLLHEKVCSYLKSQYPKVLFRTDFAAGEKLTKSQAVRNKQLQKCKGWPDLFVSEPRKSYSGLFIELKAEAVKLYKLDGSYLKDDHILEQAEVLSSLTERGYKAAFAVGFNEAKALIDNYLKL